MGKVNESELKELFIEIKHNNKIAFEKLYNRYNKLVYGVAFSILKNKEDSEDIVQTVFTKIYSLDKNKLPNTNEASWLYSITKNETINFLKKKDNNVNLDDIYEIENTDNDINRIIDQDGYNRLISKLNNKEKEIISLKVLAELSFEEIGKVLNLPTGTVKWKYYKSIHTMRILLSNLGMFIITFILSIKSFRNGAKSSDKYLEDKDNTIINKDENVSGNYRNEMYDEITGNETEKQENIIVDVPEQNNNTNYVGIGFLGLSGIFFIVTITFLIIFTKNQLKARKKLSK